MHTEADRAQWLITLFFSGHAPDTDNRAAFLHAHPPTLLCSESARQLRHWSTQRARQALRSGGADWDAQHRILHERQQLVTWLDQYGLGPYTTRPCHHHLRPFPFPHQADIWQRSEDSSS
ncbi:hypothetical protein ACIQPR_47265 [Streptomyces sp. NPDC091280]|uniref:hypothetical protein n=1 Tax=Streptomyces sp. NPDC091280 TaxID=3365984 RepID=UPI003811071B